MQAIVALCLIFMYKNMQFDESAFLQTENSGL